MSHVASLKLCHELHELSGWDGTTFQYDDFTGAWHLCDEPSKLWPVPEGEEDNVVPAYDLGYLLRKLPQNVGRLTLKHREISGIWYAKWDNKKIEFFGQAPSPEDAATLLAIELFKRGVMEKSS